MLSEYSPKQFFLSVKSNPLGLAAEATCGQASLEMEIVCFSVTHSLGKPPGNCVVPSSSVLIFLHIMFSLPQELDGLVVAITYWLW